MNTGRSSNHEYTDSHPDPSTSAIEPIRYRPDRTSSSNSAPSNRGNPRDLDLERDRERWANRDSGQPPATHSPPSNRDRRGGEWEFDREPNERPRPTRETRDPYAEPRRPADSDRDRPGNQRERGRERGTGLFEYGDAGVAPAVVPILDPRPRDPNRDPEFPDTRYATHPEPVEFTRDRNRSRSERPRGPIKRMLINCAEPEEIRIAITEGPELLEFNIERPQSDIIGSMGNIFRGIVQNVETAIQAAFIDIGLPKNGFLHVSDVIPTYGERWKTPKGQTPEGYEAYTVRDRGGRENGELRIQDLLRKGQEVLVQITKGQIRHKGPSLSTYISIPGRYLVLMPNMDKRGVSRKIEDEYVRRKLKDLVAQLDAPEGMGFIARTAAADQPLSALRQDLDYLVKLWKMTLKRLRDNANNKQPICVYEESDLVIRTVRDNFTADIHEVVIDDEEKYRKVYEFLRAVEPKSAERVIHYDEDVPLFYKFGIETEIEKTFDTRVPLKSGGFLVIEQTEALVSIDVNSGKFHDEKDAEQMALKINLEAASEICRQLRLRDLGGLIINDFIDMRSAEHRRMVERAMRDGLRHDKAKTRVCRMSPLGLIEMTRQRVKTSHKGTTYDICPHCSGTGYIKSLPSQTLYIMRKVKMGLAQSRAVSVMVTGPLAVIQHIQNEKRVDLAELEAAFRKRILFNGTPSASIRDITVTYTTAQGQTFTV